MFKFLIFIQGLTAPKDTKIRPYLLSKLEQDLKLILQNITEEYQRIINLCHDTAKIEKRDILHIHSVEKRNTVKKVVFFFKLILVMDADKYTYKNRQFKNK